jgi:cobalt-zinc-cadmium efflux system membrane fusion protein
MGVRHPKLLRALGIVAAVVLLVGVLAAARLANLNGLLDRWKRTPESGSVEGGPSPAEAVEGRPDTVRLPSDVVRTLGIQAIEARRPTQPRQLTMSGRLALDASHLARIHARFPGDVVELGKTPDDRRPGGKTRMRPLRPGDHVGAGQILAVIWSKELGETKSALVDGLSALRIDQDHLDRLLKAERNGSVSETSVQQARRAVETDRVAVAKAERTLRAWRLTEDEVDAVRAEARELAEGRAGRDHEKHGNWAKLEVRAQFAGTIVERNVALGDIVDTSSDLFKIADLNTLTVWADAYEEDLPDLLSLPDDHPWTIRLNGDRDAEPLRGTIDYVGEIIDPAQHTALVVGHLDNPRGRLRANQFITASVSLTPFEHEVIVPASAVIDDGKTTVLFVQENADRPEYTQRRVVVRRRMPTAVAVRSQLTPRQDKQGLQPVRPGDLVVGRGAVELKKALEEIQGRDKSSP